MSIGHAYHVILALAYCLGPVTLFWFVLDWSGSVTAAGVTGALFSLISPSALMFPAIRALAGGPWAPVRLFNLVYYGEAPHLLALTLLPLALLFLRRAAVRKDGWSFVWAVLSCSAVVLSNAFGALTIGLGALCAGLALNSGWVRIVAAGITSWCLSSPWLTPSLIGLIRENAFSNRGQYSAGSATQIATALLPALLVVTWWLTRRSEVYARFLWLFGLWMCAFPVLFHAAGVTLVPQAHRYQLEMEMALCMAGGAMFGQLPLKSGKWRPALTGLAAVPVVFQMVGYLNFAHRQIRPFEIEKTAERAVARWIDLHLPGQRVMVSGGGAWVFNVFSDGPQMSSGHEPTAPNFIQQIAVYQIYSGMNAGERDAEVSLLWLKAFGNQAVVVPGMRSQEVYKPYTNSRKFEGVLAVLWEGRGDTIYRVPQRTASLAHVMPPGAIAQRRPVNGLDLDPVREYVAALDDPAMPELRMECSRNTSCRINGDVKSRETVSLQINYDAGWRALVGGRVRPIRKDGLGLMVVDSGCDGHCTIDIEFVATAEVWICRFVSAAVSMGLAILAAFSSRKMSLKE